MKILSLHCDDVDFLNNAVRDADLEHHPLQRGPFDGTIKRIDIGESVIDVGSYKSSVLCDGGYPEETITFCAILENGSVCRFKSHELPSTAIACMKESSEFTFNVGTNTTWTGFQVKRELLESIDLNPDIITETIQIHTAGQTTQSIVNIRTLLAELEKLDSEEQSLLNRQIVFDKMLSCYIDAYTPPENLISFIEQRSDIVAQKAYDFVVSHTYEAPSTQEICLAAGVSIRTLQRNFKRRFGITLQSFQILHRLHLVRRTLLFAPSNSTTVSAVALQYGFMHFGHFGHYYKIQFGETPSETLERSY